ncbi:DUF2637 domain-containing protein [Nonomuraea sp. SYSU D8015]|uniref:DUF2637 domain-containing protein n=1 Tax=Nonomuraea sp. SYSU D8015 TaxID=2593644 RepID=UPI00166151BD|nr:DUF2637 domain-containing protein [Nonomuraea sp. SYSU D8015]
MNRRTKGRLSAVLADSGPVVVLAVIAAVGSFDHISSLARKYGQHGWRAWAVAVCIDLVCVMAAREIQRDKRTGRRRRGLISWPSLVLAGGIVLTLAANLAEAPDSAWGWILAATPAGAFLIAMSMIERRAGHGQASRTTELGLVWEDSSPAPEVGEPRSVERVDLDRIDEVAEQAKEPVVPALEQASPVHADVEPELPAVSPSLVAYARRLADEHQASHDRPITAELLRARMHIAPELATSLIARLED